MCCCTAAGWHHLHAHMRDNTDRAHLQPRVVVDHCVRHPLGVKLRYVGLQVVPAEQLPKQVARRKVLRCAGATRRVGRHLCGRAPQQLGVLLRPQTFISAAYLLEAIHRQPHIPLQPLLEQSRHCFEGGAASPHGSSGRGGLPPGVQAQRQGVITRATSSPGFRLEAVSSAARLPAVRRWCR